MNARRVLGRLLVAAGLFSLCAAGLASVPIAASAAAKNPTATVTPRTGLSDPWNDGQYVNVRWKGFAPHQAVGVRECVHGATSLSQCSRGNLYSSCGFLCPGDWLIGISDGKGSGSGSVPVAIGSLNVEQDRSTEVPGFTFQCGPADPCDLWIYNDPTDITSGAMVPLAFQPPVDACVGGSGVSLLGSGPASGLRQFRSLAIDVCQPPDNVDLGYVLRNSRDALDDYAGGYAPFAVSSQSMDPMQETALKAAGRTAAYAPVLASSEVFAFRIFDAKTSNQVSKLTLTPELLARIFTGQLKYWDNPEIRKLNPKIHFPTTIAPVGRADACEETLNVTRWLWSAAEQPWRDGGKGLRPELNPYKGPTDILPAVASSPNPVGLVTGPQAVANTVRTGGADFGSITLYGTLGYMDSSIAAQYNLPTVRIKFPNGASVAATRHTVERALASMQPDAHWVLRPDYGIERSSVWPMPVVSYMVIPHAAKKSDTPPDQAIGDTIGALVRTAVSPASQKNTAAGYVPLPAALVKQATTLSNQIWNGPPIAPPPTNGNGNGNGKGNTGGTGTGTGGTGSGGGSGYGGTGGTGSGSGTGSGTGDAGGQAPPPSQAPPVVPLPQAPTYLLVASPWSRALPLVVLLGLACLIVGGVMLFGGDLGGKMARSRARVRAVSPLRRRHKEAPESADEPGQDEAAA